MRILYWTGPFWPYIGGIQILATRFISAMQARGHELVVITEHGMLDLPDEALYLGIPVQRFHFWKALANRDPAELLDIQRRIAQLRRNFNPDLVHLNLAGPSAFFLLNNTALQPTPLIVALRGEPPEHERKPASLFEHAMRSANWVTAVSAAVLSRARELVPEITERSSVIHNALEMPLLPPAAISFDPPRLLCLGRLVPEKGFDLALHAMSRLVRSFPSLCLLIAGDGPERMNLENLAMELGLARSVQFIGWVAPERVPELMNQATIVLMPSRTEGLPQVSLQAAQMARPVVAARVGGLDEVVADRETGILVPPEQSNALADAIVELLMHPEAARRMGAAARCRSQQHFDWKSHLDAYDLLYQRISIGG
jgi:glycogen(starch) synthase